MKATLYTTLSKNETFSIDAGESVRKALPDIDFDNALVFVNNTLQPPEYEAQDGDIITVRVMPASSDAMPWYIWTFVVPFGFAIYGGLMAYEAKKEAEKAQEEAEKAKKLQNRPDIDNRPFLRGASNTVATGASQPYIIGRHFFTPYILCKPFYKITGTDGADEYTYTVLECGFNKQVIQKLAIDDIIIKTFSGNTPQEGAYNIDEGIFAEDGRIEISQDGGLLTDIPELNYKTVSTPCNDEIPRDSAVEAEEEEYLTYTLNPYAKDVDIAISFSSGLWAYNDDNDKVGTKVTITPSYSLDGGNNWHIFTFDQNGTASNVFDRKALAEIRFVAHHDFTKSDYDALKTNGQSAILIRVRSNGNKDGKITNSCGVLFYQSVCFDPNNSGSVLTPCKIVEDRERAFCTILGLKLKASKINEDKLKKINIITHGVARTWNGTAWSATKTATRNPAAWALEVLTSNSHPASKYDDSEIDLDSFGEFYEWCENPTGSTEEEHFKYRFDWVITQNTKKDDVLGHIMEATGAVIYYDIGGRLAVAIDRPKENALAVYNPQNIIKITNKKELTRKTDALRIKYTSSKDDLFQEDTYIVTKDGETINENSIIRDITVTGVTEHEHVVRYARRLMAVETLRPKTTTIEVGNEGVFYTPYSKVLIQDDSLKIGIGKGFTINDCEWRSGLLKKIYTNEPLTFDPMKTYGIIVNCFSADDVKPVAIKVEGTGTTNELTVLTSIRTSAAFKPEQGNIFSFGELDENGEFSKVTTEYLISAINRQQNGYSIDLVNYNEAIYDSGTIPAYTSNITQKKTEETKQLPADTVKKEELFDALTEAVDAANEAAAVVTHGVHFTQVHKIKDIHGIGDTIESLRAALDDVLRQANNGISVTDDKITLQVADSEQKTRALIELTNDRIVEAVEDMSENVYSAIEILKNQIIAMVDDDARNAQAGISVTADKIVLQVEDKERNIYSTIEQTAEAIRTQIVNGDEQLQSNIEQTAEDIIAQVSEMRTELTGLIDIQAGAVTALVEGGGAQGQMSLSLELPVMIDATTRAKFVQAASEGEVSAVYAQLEGTSGESIKYAIKGNASNAAVKALWDKAVAAGLIASQIVLSADQVNIGGKTIFTSSKTTEEVNAAISTAAADATSKANAAQSAAISTAAADATSKADAAQSAAISTAAADATSKANAAQSAAISTAAADATSKADAAQSAAISTAAADATSKANAAQSAAISTAAADATSKADAAQSAAISTAAADATSKANAAQSAAISTAANQRNEMAKKLGYSSYDAMVAAAAQGETIIDGGYLRTALIEVEELLAQNITLKNNGYIQSSNYAESNGYPTAGFKLDSANNVIKAFSMKAVGGNFNGITIDTNSTLKGFIQTDNIATKVIGGVYFIDQDTGNSASPTNNITMALVANSNNIKRVVKCGTGRYVIVFTDLDISYGSNIDQTAFSCKIIRCSDSLYSVSTNTPYGAGKYRYGRCQNKCFVETSFPVRNQTTGNFEVDTNAFVCITLDTSNLPVRGYNTDWFNGGYPETWKENNIRYWAIGITATDNNNDSFVSLVGGCQLLIEATRLV